MWVFLLSLVVNTYLTDWGDAHPAVLSKQAFQGTTGGQTEHSARRRVKLLVLSSLPPTCSRFQNKIRQSTRHSGTDVQACTCVSVLSVSLENWGACTQARSCTNDPCSAGTEQGTSGLLEELLRLNSRRSCHCGFQTSSVRTSHTSAFCVAKKKELELSSPRTHLRSVRVQFNTFGLMLAELLNSILKPLLRKQSGCCLMHDNKAILSCQVLHEDRNICARFDRTLQMADDYITASQSEASCLCIVQGWAWIINFFQVGGSEVRWSSCRSEISPVQLHF